MSLLHELGRRQVIRIALAYLAGSWLLIQVLETLFPIFGLPETSIRMVVIVLAVGFVPALILSWVFEWTPQGLKRDADVELGTTARVAGSRTLDRIIIVTLTIALAYFAIDKFVMSPARDTSALGPAVEIAKRYNRLNPLDDTSIAVLPFTNMSDDPEQQHFADGLTEELLNSLATIKDLRVISRTSSFAFRDRDQSIPEIAAALGVGHVLEGSVRRSGDRIRITAQLIETGADKHLWSETFDRMLNVENVLDIQEEIAKTVASALHIEMLPAGTTSDAADRPVNLVAFDLYMDGLYYANKLGPFDDDVEASTDKAIEKLMGAIAADPDWAPPRHELGKVYYATRHDGDPAERLRTARGHVLDALRLDENYGPAHASLGYLLAIDGDYAGALREYDRAEDLGSDSEWGKAILYRILGRHSDAIAKFHEAAVGDPLSSAALMQLFETYYCAGEAAKTVDGLTEFFPDLKGGYFAVLLAKAYARSGDIPNALRLANEFVADEGDEAPMAAVFALAGETDRARRALDSTDETAAFIILDAMPAAILLGDYDRAMDLLERAAGIVESDADTRYNWLWRLHCDPSMQKLAGNPRYEALLDRFGLPD